MNLPGLVTRNFRLKVGCALLAVVTWAGVVYAGNPPETKTFSVPVPQQTTSIPAGFVLIHPIANIPVKIGGTRDAVNAFDPASNLAIMVGWSKVKSGGAQSLPIRVVNNDSKVEVVDAPTSVQANIDTLASATLPVTVVVTKNPPPGILVTETSTSPSTVSVAGPRHELNGAQARVSVDLSAAKANFQAQIKVYLYGPHGDQLSDLEFVNNQGSVTVNISLTSNFTSRLVPVLPQIVGRQSAGYVVTGVRYSPETVMLSGPQDLLNTIDSVSTSAISISGITQTLTESVPIQVPLSGVTVSATLVTVTILVAPVSTPTPPPTPTPTPAPPPTP